MKVRMRHLEPGDDERDSFSGKRFHLRGTNFASNDREVSGDLIRKVYPVIDFEAGDDKGVARADRSNREERNTDVVAVDESAREFAIDDFGEKGAHGPRIVECRS